MKMIYIVKYKKDNEENSVFFDNINEAETFCKGLLSKGIKSIIEIEKEKPKNTEEERKIRVENILKIYKENLNMPNEVYEKSIEICNEAFNRKIHIGIPIENVIAGSIYISYRIFGIPKTLREISNAYPIVDRKTIFKYSEILIRELNLKIPIISKNKYINEIASKFDFNEEEIKKANEILEKIKDVEYFKYKDPVVLISSILYIVSDEKYTIKEFVERIGISDLALINTVRDIRNYLKLGLEGFEKEKIKEKEEKEKEKWIEEIVKKEMGLKGEMPEFFTILIILLIAFFILFLINFFKIVK
jgi:transcription initiation factor TFIIIB Brf1 subunit/transcription initiation factor TFIIB